MRRAFQITIPFLIVVFLFSSALAIERVPKKSDTTSQEKKEEIKSQPSVESKKEKTPPEEVAKKEIEVKKPEKEKGIFKILKKLKPKEKEKLKERYDYFIDKNGDGIDDRLEKKKTEKKKGSQIEKKKGSSERKARGRK